MSSHAGNDRAEVIPFVPAGISTLLDVGCSDGRFAELIQRERRGLAVDGVEPDPETATVADVRLRTVYRGLFPEAVPEGQRYDCITFLDCLEHFADPWGSLGAAERHLNPGGTIVASLPNIRYAGALYTILRHKDWPWDDTGIFDRTHLRFFTKLSMRRLFEDSGYAVERCAPINQVGNLKARALAVALGSDVRALQFAIVARPGSTHASSQAVLGGAIGAAGSTTGTAGTAPSE
jgi:SAM-dependent methyltransferase